MKALGKTASFGTVLSVIGYFLMLRKTLLIRDSGCGILDTGLWIQDTESRVIL